MSNNTCWVGTWQSKRGPQISGNIYVKLTSLASQENARVMFTYTGSYNNGMQRVLDFSIEPDTYTFVPVADDNIRMRVTSRTDEVITGEYNMSNPWDSGTFRVDIVDNLNNVMFVNKNARLQSQCIVC